MAAARKAVHAARRASDRPWWVKRALTAVVRAPLVAGRAVGGFLVEVFGDLAVVLFAWAQLLAVGLLLWWGLTTAPVVTVGVVVVVIAVLARGRVVLKREEPRGPFDRFTAGAYTWLKLWGAALLPAL
ncbi:putative membrane protein [Saccharothrix espanaensis DSM 44229]|uniref:Putative membrane protein n=1 Tax=Saccharothrix espanaensis (strain ATCC 51144 / DSM 44229 / JCM 9112 / NBRC 15066 / NRRL 15764) TaxID=1179773 RepID=K0KGD0_SACES|nr:putative membrane protein [Saccharothrix espanaensis DSM 44229]